MSNNIIFLVLLFLVVATNFVIVFFIRKHPEKISGFKLEGSENEIVEKLNYEQPHISKSLIKLKEAGLIKDRKEGLNVYYSLKICCMGEFFNCLNKILESESKS